MDLNITEFEGKGKGGGGSCECSKQALETMIFPFEYECDWHPALQGTLYAIALVWMFFGAIAIVANLFMEAIEVITSKRTERINLDGSKQMVLVWNPTVANLTLMALGSSLPEIMLSVVDILSKNFHSGDLGPGTIVGSAAFNLLVIIAICVSCIPDGQVRRVDAMGVYKTTAVVSVLAYFWLWLVLTQISPNIIEVGEAVITLVAFPLLVFAAYAIDVKLHLRLGKRRVAPAGRASSPDGARRRRSSIGWNAVARDRQLAPKQARNIVKALAPEDSGRLSEAQIAEIGRALRPKTRAEMRAEAMGNIVVKKASKEPNQYAESVNELRQGNKLQLDLTAVHEDAELLPPTVTFVSKYYVVGEGDGEVKIGLMCSPPPTSPIDVAYKTRDGTVGAPAKAGSDYVHTEGVVTFGAGEALKTVRVTLIDDSVYEPDETFEVALASVRATKAANSDSTRAEFDWDEGSRCTVKIVDDDFPGCLGWASDKFYADEGNETATLVVTRTGGGAGEIKVQVRSEDGLAVGGADYTPVDAHFALGPGQMELKITVALNAVCAYSEEQTFTMKLLQTSGGATLDEAKCVACVHLCESKDRREYYAQMASIINEQLQTVSHASTWGEQFKDAWAVEEGAGPFGYFVHYSTLFWKLLFATTPPPAMGGGVPCFFVCVGWIAVVTVIVSDLAITFGCVVGLKQTINAITLVALGTSLPDTFASKSAAVNDPTADAAIGNVTGSNCVNIFLGVGLPWLIAAVKWRLSGSLEDPEWMRRYGVNFADNPLCKNGCFVVESYSLSSSVFFFMIVALLCLGTLTLRRKAVGGELGGPRKTKHATSAFFFGLWMLFVLLSALQAYDVMPTFRR